MEQYALLGDKAGDGLRHDHLCLALGDELGVQVVDKNVPILELGFPWGLI